MQEKPSICYATKKYIKDIQSKEWPEIDEKEYLQDEAGADFTPKYIAENSDAENKITPVPESNEQSIFEPEKHDANPLIFYRIAKPLKEDKELPSLDLSKFFKKSMHHGLKLEIKPDYSYEIVDQVRN